METLKTLIEKESYSKHQTFNSDETGLNWKVVQSVKLVNNIEKHARGFKLPKDRLAIANASGDFHLPLVLIFIRNYFLNPRALKRSNRDAVPGDYYVQRKRWIDSMIFTKCSKSNFVPRVKRYSKSKGIPVKVLLLIYNAPFHPSIEELSSWDGSIKTMFLPTNTTSMMQPMDQIVLHNLKQRYKRSLLREIDTIDRQTFDSFAKDCIIL